MFMEIWKTKGIIISILRSLPQYLLWKTACFFFSTTTKNKQLTQLELSEELGITPRHLQAIENENKTPSYDLLSRMLFYLNIPRFSLAN